MVLEPNSVLVKESIPDETGFTTPEKIALRNAWTRIGPNMEFHAKEQFLNFFTEHELLLNKFRGPDGHIKMYELHMHPKNIFLTLEDLIFEGLDSEIQIHGIISPIAIRHHKAHCYYDEVKLLADAVADYLKTVLRRKLSPTLENGIDKLCAIIITAHK